METASLKPLIHSRQLLFSRASLVYGIDTLDRQHAWMTAHRLRATDETALARAPDYSLKPRAALTRYIEDAELLIDNNRMQNQIQPIGLECR